MQHVSTERISWKEALANESPLNDPAWGYSCPAEGARQRARREIPRGTGDSRRPWYALWLLPICFSSWMKPKVPPDSHLARWRCRTCAITTLRAAAPNVFTNCGC